MQTFFCGCAFDESGLADATSCNVSFKDANSRRIVWIPLVPRRAARSAAGYDHVVEDPRNLVPEVAAVAEQLNGKVYQPLGSEHEPGDCGLRISGDAVDPPVEARGDIARAHAYLQQAYPGAFDPNSDGTNFIRVMDLSEIEGDPETRQMRAFWITLLEWSGDDPIDSWERTRDERIESHFGGHNDALDPVPMYGVTQ